MCGIGKPTEAMFMSTIAITSARRALLSVLAVFSMFLASQAFAAGGPQASAAFAGPKANTGTVTLTHEGAKRVLTLSSDFVSPDTPDPHWQVVDSSGNVYTLERLKIKEDREHRSVTLPAYVRDVAKVVIWCAFAEANLGEAKFAKPVK
jgi:hypothetical protein